MQSIFASKKLRPFFIVLQIRHYANITINSYILRFRARQPRLSRFKKNIGTFTEIRENTAKKNQV